MTAPRTETINIVRGDDYLATFQFDQLVSTFSEMRFTIRDDWATTETDNTGAVLSVALTASGAYTADLALSSADTLTLQARQYVYDVSIVTALGGRRFTTQRGMLRPTPDCTRG